MAPRGNRPEKSRRPRAATKDIFDKVKATDEYKDVSKIVSAVHDVESALGSVASTLDEPTKVLSTIKQIGVLLGLTSESGVEDKILAELNQIEADVRATLAAVLTSEQLDARRDIVDMATEAMAGAEVARNVFLGGASALTPDQTIVVDYHTLHGVSNLANDVYWLRPYNDHSTDGEWKNITTRRAAHTDTIFEYRDTLPSFMAALASRVEAMGMIHPDFVQSGFYSGELAGYVTKLTNVLNQIESNIACGYEVWRLKNTCSTFQVRSICADMSTGAEVPLKDTTATGSVNFSTFVLYPATPPSNGQPGRGAVSCSASSCGAVCKPTQDTRILSTGATSAWWSVFNNPLPRRGPAASTTR